MGLNMQDNSVRNRTIAIISAIIVILLAVFLLVSCNQDKTGTLSVEVKAEGYNPDTSTPIQLSVYEGDVVEVLADTDEANDPESITTFTGDANTTYTINEVTDPGTYTVVVDATPILEDGTLFGIPDPKVIEVANNAETATFELVPLDLATASAEEVAEVTKTATEAAESTGDTTKVEAVAAGSFVASDKAAQYGNRAVAVTALDATTNATQSKPNNTNASQSQSSSNLGSSSKPATTTPTQPTQPSKPAHEHNWQPITKTVHHDAVTKFATVCTSPGCGVENPSRDHLKYHALNGEQSGTAEKTIVVTPAYDETVTTGYKCSCGATK